jgi:outer membrane protein TolC
VRSQVGSLNLAKIKKEEGAASGLDVAQAVTNVASTEANIPQLQTQMRQAENRLCILMGIPPQDLSPLLNNEVPIPVAPPQIAIGVPADILRRRPDVRRAERLAAAQSARIGITEAALYPAFTLNGQLFVQASDITNLFTQSAVGGNVGPSFSWNLLNYGRIWNSVNAEEALFMQRVTEYQNAVLNANREAEDSLVGFLLAQEQARILRVGVDAAIESRDLINELYKGGRADFGRVFVAEAFLATQQDQLALAEGAIAGNLVRLYRSLGGGWELRLQENGDGQMQMSMPQPANRAMEEMAPPQPNPAGLPEMLPQPERE